MLWSRLSPRTKHCPRGTRSGTMERCSPTPGVNVTVHDLPPDVSTSTRVPIRRRKRERERGIPPLWIETGANQAIDPSSGSRRLSRGDLLLSDQSRAYDDGNEARTQLRRTCPFPA